MNDVKVLIILKRNHAHGVLPLQVMKTVPANRKKGLERLCKQRIIFFF